MKSFNNNKTLQKLIITVGKKDNKIHYLDYTMINEKHKLNNLIYRKPILTNLTIPNNNNHSTQQIMSAYNALMYRMLQILLSKIKR